MGKGGLGGKSLLFFLPACFFFFFKSGHSPELMFSDFGKDATKVKRARGFSRCDFDCYAKCVDNAAKTGTLGLIDCIEKCYLKVWRWLSLYYIVYSLVPRPFLLSRFSREASQSYSARGRIRAFKRTQNSQLMQVISWASLTCVARKEGKKPGRVWF